MGPRSPTTVRGLRHRWVFGVGAILCTFAVDYAAAGQLKPRSGVPEIESRAQQYNSPPIYFPKQIPSRGFGFARAYPWNVALTLRDVPGPSGYFCGGVLIDDEWVLTTAHCVARQQGSGIDLAIDIIHGSGFLSKPASRVPASEIIIHEGFSPGTLEYDIALIRLSKPLKSSPLLLFSPKELQNLVLRGAIGIVSGWGRTSETPTWEFSDAAVKLPMQLISPEMCNSPTVYGGEVTPTMLCAQSLKTNSDACQGFAGSPLVFADEKARFRLAGIVSWGKGCGRPNTPGVYTNVVAYAGWIRFITGISIAD